MPDFLDVYVNYTKVTITRFPSPSGLRGIPVRNCEILPHHPNWLHTVELLVKLRFYI